MEESSPRVDPDIEKVRKQQKRFYLQRLEDFTNNKTSIKSLEKGFTESIC